MKRNIFLTGFMACGKTTVGRILATILKRDFSDTDEMIVDQTGLDVAGIFRSRGEDFFRDTETLVLREISQKRGIVAALGGGAVLREENRAILKRGAWVFLDAPFALIERRVLGDPVRPLASGGSEKLRALWLKRRPVYLEASLIVRCSDFTPLAIARLVKDKLRRVG